MDKESKDWQKKGQTKGSHRYQSLGMSLGMCFGVSLGYLIGSPLLGNSSTGLALGICLGMCIGMAIGAAKDRRVDEQVMEMGYTIQSIAPKEDGNFTVVIQDKKGNCTSLEVSAGDMKEESFEVGDLVYLDEEGEISQVTEKDE